MRTRFPSLAILAPLFVSATGGCGAILGLDDFTEAGGGDGDAATSSGASTSTDATSSASAVASAAGGTGGDGGGSTSQGGGGAGGEAGAGGLGGSGGSGGEGGAPVCTTGDEEACYEGADGTLGVGLCQGGTRRCDEGGHFGACDGQVVPVAEDCQTHADESCSPTCGELKRFFFYGGPGDEIPDTLSTFDNGDFLISGTNFDSLIDFGNGVTVQNPQDAFFMARITSDGTAVWAHALPASAQAAATSTFVTVVGTTNASTTLCGLSLAGGASFAVRFDGADGTTCLRAGAVDSTSLSISDPTSPLILKGQRSVHRVAVSGASGFVDSWTFTGPPSSTFSGLRTRGGLHYVFGSFTGTATFGSLAPLVATGVSDAFVLRLSSAGVPEAVAQLGINGAGSVRDIELANSSLYLVGSFSGSLPDPEGGSFISSDTNYFVTRASFGAALAPIWTRSEQGTFARVTLQGSDLLLLGRGDDFGGGPIGGDPLADTLVALDAQGMHLWSRRIGLSTVGIVSRAAGGARLFGYAGVATEDVFGSVDVPAAGGDDFWLADLFPVVP